MMKKRLKWLKVFSAGSFRSIQALLPAEGQRWEPSASPRDWRMPSDASAEFGGALDKPQFHMELNSLYPDEITCILYQIEPHFMHEYRRFMHEMR